MPMCMCITCVNPSCQYPCPGGDSSFDQALPHHLFDSGVQVKVLDASVDRDEDLRKLHRPLTQHQPQDALWPAVMGQTHILGTGEEWRKGEIGEFESLIQTKCCSPFKIHPSLILSLNSSLTLLLMMFQCQHLGLRGAISRTYMDMLDTSSPLNVSIWAMESRMYSKGYSQSHSHLTPSLLPRQNKPVVLRGGFARITVTAVSKLLD